MKAHNCHRKVKSQESCNKHQWVLETQNPTSNKQSKLLTTMRANKKKQMKHIKWSLQHLLFRRAPYLIYKTQANFAGTIVKKWTKFWIDSKNYKNIIGQPQITQLVCQLRWRSQDCGPSGIGIGIGMGDITPVSSVHKEKGNKKQTWKEIVIFPKVGCWYLFAQIATDVSALVIVCTFSRYEINPRNWPSTYLQYLDWLCTEEVVMNTAPPPTNDQLWKKLALTALAQNVLISKFKYWSM